MKLPHQLENPEYRFILVSGNKTPLEQGWRTTANYPYTDKRVEVASNLGIMCGVGGLVVIDFDDPTAQEKLLPHLPATFTVRTGGKGLYHLYFSMPEQHTQRINDNREPPARLFDVQGAGTQVIAPGSTNAKTGRKYEVVRDLAIAKITPSELSEAIRRAGYEEQPAKRLRLAPSGEQREGVIGEIKRALDMPSLLRHYGVKTRGTMANCPFHADSTPSMSFNRELWNCFSCNVGGDVITFVQHKENVERAEAIRRTAAIAGVEVIPLEGELISRRVLARAVLQRLREAGGLV